eukprot:Rhum_TRINITY_DN14427_c15_g1::Rhum_TRINITY_DN14427_c15_g1_i1::g.89978::m.89978
MAAWLRDLFALHIGCPITKRRRRILLFCDVVAVTGLTTVWVALSTHGYSWLSLTALICATLVSVCLFAFLASRRTPTETHIAVVAALAIVCTIAADLSAAERGGFRLWPMLTVIVNALYLMQCSRRVRACAVVVSVVWLVLAHVESSMRFGLFDLPWGTDQAEVRHELCGCSEPPCSAVGGSFLAVVYAVATLGLHVGMISIFVQEINDEREGLRSMRRAVDDVSRSIGELEVHKIDDAIDKLPEENRAGLRAIALCVRKRMPYLPDAHWFSAECDVALSDSSLPASFHPRELNLDKSVRPVVIACTGIAGIDGLWDASPLGAKRAVRMQNEVLVSCISLHGGVTAKMVGGAFMAVFRSAADAVNFGITAQVRLAAVDWPDELRWCCRCGLATTIGIEVGRVKVETRQGEREYSGDAVRGANALEQRCIPGTVALSYDVLEALHGRCELSDAGDRMFLGTLMSKDRARSSQFHLYAMKRTPDSAAGDAKMYSMLPERVPQERRILVEAEIQRGRNEGCVAQRYRNFRGFDALSRDETGSLGTVTVGMAYSMSGVDSVSGERTMKYSGAATAGYIDTGVGTMFARPETGDLTSSQSFTSNAAVARLLTSLERCEGRLVSVLGSATAVLWTGVAHRDRAFRFAAYLNSALVTTTDDAREGLHVEEMQALCRSTHVGLFSGSVLCGSVGTTAQRFVNVLGPPMHQSAELCRWARRHERFCLYGATEALDERLEACTTPFTKTLDSVFGSSGYSVYAVNPEQIRYHGLLRLVKNQDALPVQDAGPGQTEERTSGEPVDEDASSNPAT